MTIRIFALNQFKEQKKLVRLAKVGGQFEGRVNKGSCKKVMGSRKACGSY